MDIGIAGLGLIGGSLLRALHRHHNVTGFDADPATVEQARRAGFSVVDSPADLTSAELVVVAVPVPALPQLLPAFAGFGGLLTDVVSVKEPVIQAVARYCPGVRFVAGHPMAGSHQSGFAVARADLFDDRVWVVCLADDSPIDDVLTVGGLACELGCRVVAATAAEHDAAAARISHLPHVTAAALTLLAADPLSRAMAAGSFTDGTRVAATREELVSAMCVGNARPLREQLDRLIAELTRARERLSSVEQFGSWYAPAHRLRIDWPVGMGEEFEVAATARELLALGRNGGWVTHIDRAEQSVKARRPLLLVT